MGTTRWIELKDADGYQHCHGEHCDEYWYRPLVFGKDLFTYVAHIPPGGGVPSDREEANLLAMSLFTLEGDIEVVYGEERFTVPPMSALHCPKGVPVGFFNHGDKPASLVLSFAPPPGGAHNHEEMREFARKRGRRI